MVPKLSHRWRRLHHGGPYRGASIGPAGGDARLAECVTDLAHLSPTDQVARIMDAVQTFAAGTRQADDITALVLSYSPKA